MNGREVFALNLGSTTLKGARFAVEPSGGWTRLQRVSIALESSGGRLPGDSLQPLAEQLAGADAPRVVLHRIVHGGDRKTAVEIDEATLPELEALSPLAPLHQPAALDLVRRARAHWPTARHWAAFDTAWHTTMPLRHRVLPLPLTLFDQGLKRYGFHGLAFQSAMRHLRSQAADLAERRVVLAHLGGGSSVCAVRDGRSVNTTMGMTPLEGIPMASRSGSLDPGVVLHLQRVLGLEPEAVDRMLWRESGLKGLSGESADMRALLASGSEHARLAVDVYVGAVAQAIAAMAACIGGIDALVFSGGIGANAVRVRQMILERIAWLGLGVGIDVADAGDSGRIFVADVDEETEMVAQWLRLATVDA